MEYDKLKIKQKRNKGAKCQAEKRRLWFLFVNNSFQGDQWTEYCKDI